VACSSTGRSRGLDETTWSSELGPARERGPKVASLTLAGGLPARFRWRSVHRIHALDWHSLSDRRADTRALLRLAHPGHHGALATFVFPRGPRRSLFRRGFSATTAFRRNTFCLPRTRSTFTECVDCSRFAGLIPRNNEALERRFHVAPRLQALARARTGDTLATSRTNS